MKKIMCIAIREFVSTVATKAFILGLLFLPVIFAISILVISLVSDDSFQLRGEVAVIDPTGEVSVLMEDELVEAAAAMLPEEQLAELNIPLGQIASMDAAMRAMIVPDLSLNVLPVNADLEAEKLRLLDEDAVPKRLALVVVHDNAIEAGPDGELGSYDLYVPPGFDDRASGAVRGSLRDSIRTLRLNSQGFDRAQIDRLTTVRQTPSVTVTVTSGEDGVSERQTVEGFNFLLPFGVMFLVFMGVMGGGQALLTTTITEKSSRVIEVLLSAVSPLQLMAGKLIGHLSVSLLGMSIYLAAGVGALYSMSMFDLIDPMLIVYLLIFFLITFFVIGSLYLAIGAAVNDVSETQSLMMPIMIIIMLPWFLWMPISRDPSSTLSVVVSFLPPINTFGMLLRMASTEPPPTWQIWLSIFIGVLTVIGSIWFAAKVFRIGLLMHGKPPNIKTLIRWVRAA